MTLLGLGLAAIGRPDYINIRSKNGLDKSIGAFEQNAFKVLDKAYDLGIRHFDVAASYGYGERFLMNWHYRRKHSDISISTKWGYTYMANWEIGYSGKHEIKEHSLNKLNEQWSFSKRFLPSLNIYQIHSATLESGVLSNIEVLNRLNKIKQEHHLKIGISTSGPNQSDIISRAETVRISDLEVIDSYQVTYNIFEQSSFESLKNLMKKGKTVIVKEALANGRVFKNPDFPNYSKAYNLLDRLSMRYKVGVDAIALRFIIDTLKPNVVLSGASNIKELDANATCINIELDKADISELRNLQVEPKHYWLERANLAWQ
jgi:aryl-alcohol dehydrogenase-like predicted oxidoreductase